MLNIPLMLEHLKGPKLQGKMLWGELATDLTALKVILYEFQPTSSTCVGCLNKINPSAKLTQSLFKWGNSDSLLLIHLPSQIQPGPVWTWALSYALSVQGSTGTWGPTCHACAPWTSTICHGSSRWSSAPLATTWWTAYGRGAHWAAANQHLTPHGKNKREIFWYVTSGGNCV